MYSIDEEYSRRHVAQELSDSVFVNKTIDNIKETDKTKWNEYFFSKHMSIFSIGTYSNYQ